MKKNILIILITIFAVILIGGISTVLVFNHLSSPVNPDFEGKDYFLKIVQGASVISVAEDLEEKGIIHNKYVMYLLARKNGTLIKSGRYQVNPAMSCKEILEYLESGKQENVVVAIPEGLTLSKIANILEKNEVTKADAFIAACSNPEILEYYDIPGDNLEGYLFPDTYHFDYEMNPKSVISIFMDNFYSKIYTIQELVNISSEELHEKLILASIVEREYRVASEAPLIASVFVNRLKRNIGLYSCATIEYIITEIEKKPHPDIITYDDLKIDSPYNTYKWAGLPPGPISNPGLVALSAAANPPKTQYYFFRLVDEKKGTHVFTKDFESHTEQGKSISVKKAAGN